MDWLFYHVYLAYFSYDFQPPNSLMIIPEDRN